MKAIHIRFFILDSQKHKNILVYEWLLEKAQEIGVSGGTVFRAIAGYGRHKHMHEEYFFELGSEVPLEASFIVEEKEANLLIDAIRSEGLNLFFIQSTVDCGFTGST